MGDTKTMKKYATIERLVMQLEYQFKIEEAYPKNIIRKVYESVHVEKPNKLSRFNRYTSFWPNGGNKACVCVCSHSSFVTVHFQSCFLLYNVYSKYCLSQNRFGYFNLYFYLDSARPRNCLGCQELREQKGSARLIFAIAITTLLISFDQFS